MGKKNIKDQLSKNDMARLIAFLHDPPEPGREIPLGLGKTLDLSLHLARSLDDHPSNQRPTAEGPPTPSVQK